MALRINDYPTYLVLYIFNLFCNMGNYFDTNLIRLGTRK